MYFGKNLRYLRRKSGLTQEQIADRLKYKSFTTIQKWESGDSQPPMTAVKILSEMFKVPMDQLYNFDLENYDVKNHEPHHVELEDTLKYYAELIASRPELTTLIMAAKDASKEDIEKALKIIEALR